MLFNPSFRRRGRSARTSHVLAEAIEPRRLLAAVSWDGGGDGVNWNDPVNWSGNALPTTADDVTINVAANPNIVLATTTATINSLNSSENLSIQVGLTVNTTTTLNAATSISGYAQVALGGNLTVNNVLTIGGADNTYGIVYFQGNANVTLGGTGSVAVAGTATSSIQNYTYDGGTQLGRTLTIGSGIEISGVNFNIVSVYGGGAVQNDGQLLPAGVSSAGQWILGQSGNTRFINNGLIQATAGVTVTTANLVNNATRNINITDSKFVFGGDNTPTGLSWDNNGTVTATNAAIELGSHFTMADVGTMNRTGGTLDVTGRLDLAGGTLTLDNAKGTWRLASNGRIRNGVITRTGSNTLIPRNGTLEAITLNMPVEVSAYYGFYVEGGLILNDTLTLGNADGSYGFLQFNGAFDQTLGGTGGIVTAGAATQYIYSYTYDPNLGTGMKLTLGAGIEITGGNVQINSPYTQGIVQLDGSLTLNGPNTNTLAAGNTRFINNGAISITNGTTNSYNLLNNSGKTINLTNTTFNLYGDGASVPYTWDNNGTIHADNAIVNLAGIFSVAEVGTLTRVNGGQVNVAGLLDLAGGTLTLDNAKGTWGLIGGGRIKNGVIARTGANTLVPRGGIVDNITLNLPVKVAQYQYLYIENSLVLNDTLALGDVDDSYGVLQFQGNANQTLGGTGNIAGAGNAAQYIYNYTYDNSTGFGRSLTIGSGIEITAVALYLYAAYAQGVVQNDGPITLSGNPTSQLGTGNTRFINNNTISHTGGTTGALNTYNLLNNSGKVLNVTNTTLYLYGDANQNPFSWDNNGTINANNAIVNMAGVFGAADPGTINRTNGGQVNVAGLLDLGGATLTLDNTKGTWGLLSNGKIRNGTIARTGSNELIPRGGTLDNIVLNLPLKVAGYATLYIENSLTVNDLLTLGDVDNTYGVLQFIGGVDQTLGGTGGIVTSGNASGYLYNYTYDGGTGFGRQLTIGSNIEITGRAMSIYSGYTNGLIVNNGQFIANDAAGAWTIAAAGGKFINAGTVTAQTGVIDLQNLWDNNGTLAVNTGTLKFGGTFTLADVGTLTRTGPTTGAVEVTGLLDLGNSTLTLDNARGTWTLANGGRIKDGTVARTGANQLIGKNGTIENITLNAPLSISDAYAVYVERSLVLNDVITIGANAYGQLIFAGAIDQTLGGTGAINSIAGYYYNNTYDPQGTLGKTITIGSGIEITGYNGVFVSSYQNGSFLNNGVIGSVQSGGNFQLQGTPTTPFTNAGTLTATGGGQVTATSLTGNAGTLNVSGAGSVMDLNGTYTINQPATIANDALLYLRGAWTKAATFDVGGAVVFDYADATPSPINTLYAQIVTGYAGGLWNGAGIKSSRALANSAYSLGMAESTTTFPGGGGGTFFNRYVDPTSVLLRYTRKGDTNLSGTVDFDDLLKLAQNYGLSGRVWSQGDFNYNGVVNFDDLLPLAQNYGLPAFDTAPTNTKRAQTRAVEVIA